MSNQHTIRFGDAIQGLMDDEEQSGFLAGTQEPIEDDAEAQPTQVRKHDPNRDNGPTIRQLRDTSIAADRRKVRVRTALRFLVVVFSAETVDRISAVLDFSLNSAFILMMAVVGYHAVTYIAAGNPVMTLCCGAVLWIMIKASASFGNQSE